MKTFPTILMLIIASLILTWANADPCAVPVEMKEPMHRTIMELAEHDGVVTLAGERAYGKYADDKGLAERCAALSLDERRKCLACLVYEVNRARKTGDIQALTSLYKPGFSQQSQKYLRSYFNHDTKGHIVSGLNEFVRFYPSQRSLWDDYVTVGYGAVKTNGRSYDVAGWFFAQRDTQRGNWSLTQEIAMMNYPNFTVNSTKIMDAPPADARIVRLSINPDSPVENRSVIAEELPDRKSIEDDDIIVYIHDDPFPADAPPFLSMNPDALDASGRQLHKALWACLQWILDEDYPAEKLRSVWAPEAYKNMRVKVYKRREQFGKYSTATGLVGFRHQQDRDLPLLRIASRVFTNRGVVWFGWVPRPNAAGPDDADLITLFQIKLADGGFGLVQTAWVEGNDGEQLAMRVLGDGPEGKYSGIVKLLTRASRKAQLGARTNEHAGD